MHNGKGKGERKKSEKTGVNYEEAISEAFSEIFQNLKEIEKDTKLQRQILYLKRRRDSAPAEMLRQATTASTQPKVPHTGREGVSEPATCTSLRGTTTAFGKLEGNLERRRGSSLTTIPSQFNQTEDRGKMLTPPNKRADDGVNTCT